jgi:hypothetical protein
MRASQRVWTALLRRLTTHQFRFLPLLVMGLARRLLEDTRLDVHVDPFRKAIYDWMIHIFEAPEWTGPRARVSDLLQSDPHADELDPTEEERVMQGPDADLRGMVMRQCILHPGYWGFRLGRQLCVTADVWFRHDWTEVYNDSLKSFKELHDVSQISNLANSGPSAEADQDGMPMLEPPSFEEVQAAGIDSTQSGSGMSSGPNEDGSNDAAEASRSGWRLWSGPWPATPIGSMPH